MLPFHSLNQILSYAFFLTIFIVILTDEGVVVFFSFLWVGTEDLKLMIICTWYSGDVCCQFGRAQGLRRRGRDDFYVSCRFSWAGYLGDSFEIKREICNVECINWKSIQIQIRFEFVIL